MNFEFIEIPIGYVLTFLNKISGNHYILALLIFAVLIEILLIPFGIKQQKNSIKQAKLRPKEMAIRKKYAGRDDQPTKLKMQEEVQKLYQEEGYNPMSGCLPLLIQLPVLLLLYNVVINPLKYVCNLSAEAITQSANIVGVIKGLTEKEVSALCGNNTIKLMSYIEEIKAASPNAFADIPELADAVFPRLDYFGINFGFFPEFGPENKLQYVLLAVPVLTFVVYFFSMKLNRKLSYQPMTDNSAQMGCSNKIMDLVMPLFSVYITFVTPAAIGIYWIFKSILGVIKQWILKKAMPIPEFTEEDYKAAEKELNARVDKKSTVAKSGRVVRSLHHIDDEDFEDTRERALKHKEALEAQKAEEEAAKAEAPTLSSLFGGASMKKDDKKEKKSKKDKKSDKESDADKDNKVNEKDGE